MPLSGNNPSFYSLPVDVNIHFSVAGNETFVYIIKRGCGWFVYGKCL